MKNKTLNKRLLRIQTRRKHTFAGLRNEMFINSLYSPPRLLEIILLNNGLFNEDEDSMRYNREVAGTQTRRKSSLSTIVS